MRRSWITAAACIALWSGPLGARAQQTGAQQTGAQQTGPQQTGPQQSGVQPARPAQKPAQADGVIGQQVSAMAAWSAQAQTLVARLFEPFQRAPIYDESAGAAGARTWIDQSRAWIGQTRSVTAAVRTDIAALPPPPAAAPETLYQSLDLARQKLPVFASNVEDFIARFEQMLSAVERGDVDASIERAETTFDVALFMIRNLRETNEAQAALMSADHPQRRLLQSASASYNSMLALIALQREALRGEPPSRARSAASIRADLASMRAETASGRAAAAAMIAKLSVPGFLGAEEEAFRLRARDAYLTYGATFDAEAAMADALERVAATLESEGPFDALGPTIDAALDAIDALDQTRGELVRRRTQALQAP